jgi:hypothetical protein
VARKEEKINTRIYRVFVESPKGKGLHERPRRRWAYIVNMNVKETGWEGVEYTHRLNIGRSGGWALLNEVKDIRAPTKCG